MPQRTFRLVIQRIGDGGLPSFRIIVYGDGGLKANADFSTLRALLDSLDSAMVDAALDLRAEGSVLFA